MKVFDRDGKLNFVDINNVVVGFDNEGQCCEHFGYYYVYDERQKHNVQYDGSDYITDDMLADYNFDPSYCKEINDEYGEEMVVQFRLTSCLMHSDIYLRLYNHHNGYYSHGFNMDVGGITEHSGRI